MLTKVPVGCLGEAEAMRNMAAGRMYAMRTEAVEPARPKMNSTLGRKTAATSAVPAALQKCCQPVKNACELMSRARLGNTANLCRKAYSGPESPL